MQASSGDVLEPSAESAERLGRAIAAARSELGLRRRDLAERADLSYPYLSEIENGRKQPSAAKLSALAGALGLSPAELLSRSERLPDGPDSRGVPVVSSMAQANPLDSVAVPELSAALAEALHAQLRPWLEAEIARVVARELERGKDSE